MEPMILQCNDDPESELRIEECGDGTFEFTIPLDGIAYLNPQQVRKMVKTLSKRLDEGWN